MGVDAEIAVLFTAPRTDVVVPPVADSSIISFSVIDDADLHCWVSPTGQLEYQTDARSSALPGERSLEGLLWIGTLGRHWTPERPEYGGNPIIYAATLRAIASMAGVAHVWYGVLTGDGGCSDVRPASDAWIAGYFNVAQPV